MKKNLKRYLAAVLAASMVMSSTGISSLGSSIDLGSNDQSAPTSEITSGADKDLTGSGSSESGDQGSTDSSKDAGTSGEEDSDASIFDSENNAPADGSGETGGEEGSGDDGTEGGNESGGSENGGTGNTDNNNGGEDGTGSDSGSGSSGNGQPGNGGTEPDGEEGAGAGAGAGDNESTTPSGSEGDDSVTGGTTPGNPAEKPAGDGGHTGGGSSTPENNAGNNNTTPDKPADVTSGNGNAAEGTNSVTGGTTPEKPQPETEKKPEVEIEEEPEDEPEDELQSYILESITFPGEELISYTENADTSEAGTEDDKEEKGVMASLFSLFSADETEEEPAETGEAEEDNEDIRYYVERHINVGDDISAADLPDKITLKVRKADDDSFASPTNYSKDKSNNTKNITIDLDPEDWEIVSPVTLSGSIDNLDTSGIETINDDGTITVSDVYAVYPEYLLIPDFDSMDLEANEGIMLYTDNLTAGSDISTFEEYLAKNSAVMLTVGDVRPLDEGETEIDITLNQNAGGNVLTQIDDNFATYDHSSRTLTLTADGATYNITGSNTGINIVFAEQVNSATLVLKDTSIGAYEPLPVIDLDGVNNVTINLQGQTTIDGNMAGGIHVPEGTSLTIAGGGILNVTGGGDGSAAIGAANNEDVGNISILGGEVNAHTGARNGVVIGTNKDDSNGVLTIGAENNETVPRVFLDAASQMNSVAIGGMDFNVAPKSNFAAYVGRYGYFFILLII